jgi:hypothetical protein
VLTDICTSRSRQCVPPWTRASSSAASTHRAPSCRPAARDRCGVSATALTRAGSGSGSRSGTRRRRGARRCLRARGRGSGRSATGSR